MSEEILAVKAEFLDKHKGFLNEKDGVYTLSAKTDLTLFNSIYQTIKERNLLVVDRDSAEKDEGFKQIIPYVILKRVYADTFVLKDKDQEILKYERTKKAGESRLHAKWSIGFGGHMNPVSYAVRDIIRENALRELREELNMPKGNLFPIGFIYDSTNEVGRVHFGIVFEYEIEGQKSVSAKEDQLDNLEWKNPSILKEQLDKFESWSRIALEKFI